MKTHKVRYADWDSHYGCYDGSFTTFCGLTENNSEEVSDNTVAMDDHCTCKTCERAYQKHLKEFNEYLDREIAEIKKWELESLIQKT